MFAFQPNLQVLIDGLAFGLGGAIVVPVVAVGRLAVVALVQQVVISIQRTLQSFLQFGHLLPVSLALSFQLVLQSGDLIHQRIVGHLGIAIHYPRLYDDAVAVHHAVAKNHALLVAIYHFGLLLTDGTINYATEMVASTNATADVNHSAVHIEHLYRAIDAVNAAVKLYRSAHA